MFLNVIVSITYSVDSTDGVERSVVELWNYRRKVMYIVQLSHSKLVTKPSSILNGEREVLEKFCITEGNELCP